MRMTGKARLDETRGITKRGPTWFAARHLGCDGSNGVPIAFFALVRHGTPA